MKEIFTSILDRNETVIKVYKPNKTKYMTKNLLLLIFPLAFALAGVLMAMYVSDGEAAPAVSDPLWALLPVGVAVLVYVICAVLFAAYYNNLYFAYTDKRIMIRSGLFGVDFKCLDMKMVGATTVNVSVLDKILGKNTGTITFGSMASPMTGDGKSSGGGYVFTCIEAPYETYREIKELIEDKKAEK